MKNWLCVNLILLLLTTGIAAEVSIIPKPVSVTYNDGLFNLTNGLKFDKSDDFAFEQEFLTKSLPNGVITKGATSTLSLSILHKEGLPDESYQLTVTADTVSIVGADRAGLFYGLQTLIQLITPDGEVVDNIPCLEIVDYPRFGFRGVMLDVGRYFFPPEFIKKFIDYLVMYKMNKFHWHLTDDHGWRIEIKKYPKLTEVGAWRKETLIGHYRDKPRKYDGKRYGGFYTQEQIKEIVAYAQKRHVEIIPEIDLPSHCQALVASYPNLGCLDEKVEVETCWGCQLTLVNPFDDTRKVLKEIIDEVIELFPSEYICLGGDEPFHNQWRDNKEVQEFMKSKKLENIPDLLAWFFTDLRLHVESRGRKMVCWADVAQLGTQANTALLSWRTPRETALRLNQGYKVVECYRSACFFDYLQDYQQQEPLAIFNNRVTSLEKVYNFDITPKSGLSRRVNMEDNFLGGEACLWTEYVSTPSHAEYMLFPRLCAFSENLWNPAKKKNFGEFKKRLDIHCKRFDTLGISYRKDPLKIASLEDNDLSEEFQIKEYDISSLITGPGKWSVIVRYNKGESCIVSSEARLFEDGKEISSDIRLCKTGRKVNKLTTFFTPQNSVNSYILKLSEYNPNSRYVLKLKAKTDKGADFTGKLYLKLNNW